MRKIFCALLAAALCLFCCAPVLAADGAASAAASGGRVPPLVVDSAGLLDSEEEAALCETLEDISARQLCDVAVVTEESLEGKTAQEFADDFFDENGYGCGGTKDGILLVLGMQDKAWAISTHGAAIDAFTDAGQQYMTDRFVPLLSEGDYAAAFGKYAELCDDFLAQARTGSPYDEGNLPKAPVTAKDYLICFALSFLLGLLPAFLIVRIMKKKMAPVERQLAADRYVRPGTLVIQNGGETFINSAVTSREIETNSNSGGSSTHVSSSGETHGGSSGRF